MDNQHETYADLFSQEECTWKPAVEVKFWFARHGVSEYNLDDRIGGDSSITEEGRVFANALPSLFGHILQQSGEDHRFISIWTSTLQRTIQTAIKLPLPQIHLSELDEINAGVCDGATYEYIKTFMPYVHYNRKKDKLRYRYPSGESYIDLCRRVWPIVQAIKRQGGSKLVIGHQAVLRCIFGYLQNCPLEEITRLSVPHHHVFEFTVFPDGTIKRQDFHMDLVLKPSNPSMYMPAWPFDVLHSRPLTDADIARYSPKPKVPLLIKRAGSLSQGPPAEDAPQAAAADPLPEMHSGLPLPTLSDTGSPLPSSAFLAASRALVTSQSSINAQPFSTEWHTHTLLQTPRHCNSAPASLLHPSPDSATSDQEYLAHAPSKSETEALLYSPSRHGSQEVVTHGIPVTPSPQQPQLRNLPPFPASAQVQPPFSVPLRETASCIVPELSSASQLPQVATDSPSRCPPPTGVPQRQDEAEGTCPACGASMPRPVTSLLQSFLPEGLLTSLSSTSSTGAAQPRLALSDAAPFVFDTVPSPPPQPAPVSTTMSPTRPVASLLHSQVRSGSGIGESVFNAASDCAPFPPSACAHKQARSSGGGSWGLSSASFDFLSAAPKSAPGDRALHGLGPGPQPRSYWRSSSKRSSATGGAPDVDTALRVDEIRRRLQDEQAFQLRGGVMRGLEGKGVAVPSSQPDVGAPAEIDLLPPPADIAW